MMEVKEIILSDAIKTCFDLEKDLQKSRLMIGILTGVVIVLSTLCIWMAVHG